MPIQVVVRPLMLEPTTTTSGPDFSSSSAPRECLELASRPPEPLPPSMAAPPPMSPFGAPSLLSTSGSPRFLATPTAPATGDPTMAAAVSLVSAGGRGEFGVSSIPTPTSITAAPAGATGGGGGPETLAVPVAAAASEVAPHDEPWFLGDVALSFAVSFLRWVLRNPKTFSSMLVTLMLILFGNYAQNIVVEVVEFVVKAHPDLYPSGELRSKALVLGNELRSYVNVAQTTGAAYVGRKVSCSNLSSIMTTEFLNVPFALQTSFGVALYFVYVSYQIPGTSHWGDCGCQGWSYTSSDPAICGYIDASGTQYAFNGTNPAKMFAPPLSNAFVDGYDYIANIKSMTAADQAAGGIWHAPTTYDDPFLRITLTTLTYSFPLAFDPVTGACTLAVSVDIATNYLVDTLQLRSSNTEVVFAGYGRGQPDLRFVSDSLQGSLGSRAWSATSVPIPRIQSILSAVVNYADQFGNVLGPLQNVSFVQGGLLYQSLTVLNQFVVIAQGPTALATPQIGDALLSLLQEFSRSAQALRASYTVSAQRCQTSADSMQSNLFVRELSQLMTSFGVQVFASYLAYALRGDGTGARGICGCQQGVAGNSTTQLMCFYVNSAVTMTLFNDPKNPSAGSSTMPFPQDPRAALLAKLLPTITSQTNGSASGFWTAPYPYFDPITLTNVPLVTYVLPVSFDAVTGECTDAVLMDISLLFVPRLLTRFTRNGRSDIHLVDTTALRYMGSSSAYFSDNVYGVLATPNATINSFMTQVYNQVSLNSSFDISLSLPFGNDGSIINYGRVGRWAIVEIIAVPVALSEFYPIPSITSSSQALALLPMNINLELFTVVLAIIFLYTLNLFILGCSTVGENPGGAAAATAPAPAPVAPSTAATAASK